MAETIRDVTIRVSLQQVQGEALAIPDLEQANVEFRATSELLASIRSESVTTFSSLDESVSSIDVTQVSSSLTVLQETVQLLGTDVAKLGPQSKSSIDVLIESLEEAGDHAGELEDALKQADTALARLGEGDEDFKRLSKAAEQARQKLSELHDKSIKAAFDVGEGFKTAGDGALSFANSAAMLFSDTEQDAQRLLETIGRVQEGFNLFKGAFDTVKGVTEAMRALTVATGASSAAEAIHIATTKAMTVVLGEATVAALGLDAGLAPVLPILLLLAAAGAALYVAWQWFSSADEDVEQASESVSKFNAVLELTKHRLSDVQEGGDFSIAQQRLDLEEEIAKRQEQQLDAQSRMHTLQAAALKQRDAAARLSQKIFEQNGKVAEFAARNQQIRVTYMQQNRDALREAVSTHDTVIGQLKQEKALEEGKLQTIKQQIEEQQNQFKSAAERFGQLDRSEQEEIKKIVAKGGPSDRDEAELLQRIGSSLSGGFYRQQAAAAGFTQGFAKQAGTLDETETDVKRRLESELQTSDASATENRIQDLAAAIRERETKTVEILNSLVETLPELQENNKDLQRLETRVKLLEGQGQQRTSQAKR